MRYGVPDGPFVPTPPESANPEQTPAIIDAVTVVTSKPSYTVGDTATVTISISNNSDARDVSLEVIGPAGETRAIRTLSMGPDESTAYAFRIDGDWNAGNYMIMVTASDDGRTVEDVAYFKVRSQFDAFHISSVQVDRSGRRPVHSGAWQHRVCQGRAQFGRGRFRPW